MFCKLQTVWFLRQTLFALFCPTGRGVGGGWPKKGWGLNKSEGGYGSVIGVNKEA